MDTKLALNSADTNYFESWKVIVAAASTSNIQEDDEHPGLIFVSAGLSVPLFNVAFITREMSNAGSAVDKAINYFKERNLSGLICVRDGVDPLVDKAAIYRGLKLAAPHPGMILQPIIANDHNNPHLQDFEIAKVLTDNDIDDFARIANAAFKMPEGVSRKLTTQSTINQPGVTYFIGKLCGKPIATSALIRTNNVAGIYWVTVDKDYRRRGYGTQMCWAAAKLGAEEGCELANLQASELGKHVYEAMGFEVALPYNNYEVPASE